MFVSPNIISPIYCVLSLPLLRLSGFGFGVCFGFGFGVGFVVGFAVGFAVGFGVGFALADGGDSRFKSCVTLRLDPTPPKPPQPAQLSAPASSLVTGLVSPPPRLGSANGRRAWGRVRPTVNGLRRESAGPSGRARPPLAPGRRWPRVRPPLGPVRALPTDATGASVPFAIMAGRLGWAGRLR